MIKKPKGTYDLIGKEAKTVKWLNSFLDSLCQKYNYEYIRTPVFESSEVFHRSVGQTSDIIKKETYDFTDRGNRNLTLRPEGTAAVLRSYIENKLYGRDIQPVKLYYNQMMYRYERPQAGRTREFNQFGVEVLGSDDILVDAEVISLAYNIFELLNIANIKVNINSLGDEASRKAYKEVLVKYLKNYTDDMCSDCQQRLVNNPLRVLDCKLDAHKEWMTNAPKITDYLNEESLNRFNKLQEYLDLLDINYEVNPRLVRGLDYYNHTVFEIEYLSDNFGSQNIIAAGGRYNGLSKALDGPDVGGIGFAMGLERILLVLEEQNINIPYDKGIDVFIGYVSEEEKNTAVYLLQELRLNGFSADTEFLAHGLKSQLNKADKLESRYVIILNEKDIANYEVTLKDNKTKEEQKIKINDLCDFLDMNI